MNESSITREIAKLACCELATDRGRSIQPFKHSDRFTRAVPDVSITVDGATAWFEFKLADNPRIFEPIQISILRRLVHAHLVVWDKKHRLGTVISNDYLYNDYRSVHDGFICDLTKRELAREIAKLCLR